ncbi:MAG: hypothetical protein JW732_07245 [Dehalococcoidia bacterium]|nr:hypothetical protein [Dehalococcoidia bacterium]
MLPQTEKYGPAFVSDKGFEQCAFLPGVGAWFAAQIIIEDRERGKARES